MASSNPSISQIHGDKGPHSFWTVCLLCHSAHEYTKKYENLDLLCQTCRRPFRAMAMASAPPMVPGTDSYYYWGFAYGGYPSTVSTSSDIRQNVGFPWRPPFSPSHPSTTPAEDAHMGSSEQQRSSCSPSQRWHSPTPIPSKNGNSRSKLGNLDGNGSGVLDKKVDTGVLKTDPRVTRSRSSAVENDNADTENQSLTHASPVQGNLARNARNLLENKAKLEILKNLSEHPSAEEKLVSSNNTTVVTTTAAPITPVTESRRNYKTEPKVRSPKSSKSRKNSKGPKKRTNSATNQKKQESNYVAACSGPSAGKPYEMIQEIVKDVVNVEEVKEPLDTSFSIDVPDSDFYNFDDDRTEYSFEEGHIWAVYDEEDGMPRIYAQIQKVISHMPFTVKLSWLQSVTGTKRSCGKFRIGSSTTTDVLNLFSHTIVCDTSPLDGGLTIYPKKNEVWAVHDRSSADRKDVSRYKIVEILHDYADEHSGALISLVKVCRFKSIYQRWQSDLGSLSTVWSFSMNDLHNLSHQIPARKIEEYVPDLPDNCWELDPAAIPECLLKGVSV